MREREKFKVTSRFPVCATGWMRVPFTEEEDHLGPEEEEEENIIN